MKRYIIEYANDRKKQIKSMSTTYSTRCINEMLTDVEKTVNACKYGLITSDECISMLSNGHFYNCANGINERVINGMLFELDMSYNAYKHVLSTAKTKSDIQNVIPKQRYYKGMLDAYNNVLIGTNNYIILDLESETHVVTNRYE